MSEWLRRWTRNPLGSARRGSNPLGVEYVVFYILVLHGARVSQAGAWTWLQSMGHGDMQGLDSPSLAFESALLCFFFVVEKKRMQPQDILKISWFLSSVLCCAFWKHC